MSENHMPRFINESSCTDKGYDPDWWHPQELAGRGRKWSHTPEAELARSICLDCPALKECEEYSMKYSNLTGIWAGIDRIERHAKQDEQGTPVIDWMSTWNSNMFRGVSNEGKAIAE